MGPEAILERREKLVNRVDRCSEGRETARVCISRPELTTGESSLVLGAEFFGCGAGVRIFFAHQ